jgi:hypothetical protein
VSWECAYVAVIWRTDGLAATNADTHDEGPDISVAAREGCLMHLHLVVFDNMIVVICGLPIKKLMIPLWGSNVAESRSRLGNRRFLNSAEHSVEVIRGSWMIRVSMWVRRESSRRTF